MVLGFFVLLRRLSSCALSLAVTLPALVALSRLALATQSPRLLYPEASASSTFCVE